MMGNLSKDPKAAQADADDEDDVPPLVQGTFEDAAKKWVGSFSWNSILAKCARLNTYSTEVVLDVFM